MIVRNPLKCINTRDLSTISCEIAEWKIAVRNKSLTLLGVYRPPAIKGKANSITSFTDEFMEIVQEQLIRNQNVIIMGDFNIHIDDVNNQDAQGFMDCMTSMGLDQHVENFTHNKLHTLDLIFSKIVDGLRSPM